MQYEAHSQLFTQPQRPDSNPEKRNYDSIDGTPPSSPSKKQRLDPIEHWRREGKWPSELFEPKAMPLLDRMNDFSAYPLHRTSSSGESCLSSPELDREEKAAPYEQPRYEHNLQLFGVFMREDDTGPLEEDIAIYRGFFAKDIELPPDTNFADHLFEQTMRDCHGMNEARIIRDIGLLICPSPEDLLKRGATSMKHLCESVDEGWRLSRHLTFPPPQPDFSVGFIRHAFTEEQLEKVRPILGNSDNQASYFRATWYMYFPFLSCEAKKGGGPLDVADRQNTHSMGIAVRGVVALYRLAGRAEQLNRKILAFSISYNDSYVRIYSYYPVVKGPETKIYRHRVADIAIRESKLSRWKAYKFTKAIYEYWAPSHLKSLQSILTEMEPVEIAPTVKSSATPLGKTAVSQILSCSSLSSGVLSSEPTPLTGMAAPVTPGTSSGQGAMNGKKASTKR